MKKFWDWINGKKTIIAVIVYLLHMVLVEVVGGIFGVEGVLFEQIAETLQWVYEVLGTIGVGHGIAKKV